MNTVSFRYEPIPADIQAIRDIVVSTEFFNAEEIEIAVYLIEERLNKGISSGYYFVFAEMNGETVAYSCYGPIDGTQDSHDLYWIVTHNNYRGKGIGKALIAETEKKIAQMDGNGIYVETASKHQYEPTRKFYENCGYILEARLKHFYAPDDDKLIYVKRVKG
jgi:GNAT superfamily N-acetyltransferase